VLAVNGEEIVVRDLIGFLLAKNKLADSLWAEFI
jgi:hypothetical protein